MEALAKSEPRFALKNALPELRTLMRRPVKPLRALIIDDNELTVTAMYHIMVAWPSLTVDVTIQTRADDILSAKSIERIAGYDIVFMDEELDGVRGSDILNRLHERGVDGYPWIVVSTSSAGNTPGYSRHFSRKAFLHSSFEEATAFIKEMNAYVVEAELGLSL